MKFSSFPGRILGALLAVWLVSGCVTTRYEYVAPTTEHGRMCAMQCSTSREFCQQNEMNRAQYEQQACEQRSDYQYHDCLHHARSDKDAKRCFRQACFSNANTWRCDENYRQCFTGCGGTVHAIREE